MVMTSAGQSVRIKVNGVRPTSRNTQGVKLMNLKDGEIIQDIARVIADEEEDEQEGEDGVATEAADTSSEATNAEDQGAGEEE